MGDRPEIDAAGLYLKFAPSVLGYLRGQGVEDPDDLLGEVFLQVARSLPKFRGDDDHLRRWVFAIARNRVIDDRRTRQRRPQVSGADVPDRAGPSPPEQPDPALLRALHDLTDDQREVIVLRFVADLSLEEVATLTGRPVGAVKSMQHRALDQLARILGVTRSAETDDEPER